MLCGNKRGMVMDAFAVHIIVVMWCGHGSKALVATAGARKPWLSVISYSVMKKVLNRANTQRHR